MLLKLCLCWQQFIALALSENAVILLEITQSEVNVRMLVEVFVPRIGFIRIATKKNRKSVIFLFMGKTVVKREPQI